MSEGNRDGRDAESEGPRDDENQQSGQPRDEPGTPPSGGAGGTGPRIGFGSDLPTGGAGRPKPDEDPQDPLAGLFAAFMGGGAGPNLPPDLLGNLPPGMLNLPGMPQDPQSLQAMLNSVQQMMMSGGDGPVNWELATTVARQAAAEGGDPSVGDAQHRKVAEALRTADLWLDRVCDLPAATGRTEAWSRAEWIENTLGVWKVVVEPVALSVGEAMAKALTEQAPPEMRALLGGALPMMRKMGGTFFGAQLGHAIGGLSREVIGGGDVGLPLLPAGKVALIPVNLSEFGNGLGLEEDEVRLYLALREAAHARLVAGVPWLRSHLLAAVEEYARGIVIDTDRIESAIRDIDPSDPEAMQQALASDIFEPERTPQQQAALDRLETALALVEGWVDTVVDEAARHSLPHASALQETIRRRRAAGGPAEHTFASLVGLELRPRRLREAAAVWSALTAARGAAGRDALWAHPDIAPDEAAFADPVGFAQVESQGDDMDAELARMLDGGLDEEKGDGDK
ncbi:zinc-dependent metalloprotease [Kineosporia rhizophila]|uniref:zinc-dependent metalloprotease n=1 Tax=Kineosporia TaxID=49184 RepID=UPI001E659FA3|nr:MULTISPECIES: zinc-dependent metalloprotease [Kineosporia]MCE0536835.1 zinc-dependent metalloprotease [Kineosporia rhizophila]GLY13011.1 hydrolase [Kineosporia sp. NBRC 101677]